MAQKPSILPIAVLVSLIFAVGCSGESEQKKVNRQWYEQTCEMCGAEWLVSPSSKTDTVSPTVEWCFNDGRFCEEGFSLYIKLLEKNEAAEQSSDWIHHCRKCTGCKCATFKPEQWREVVNEVQ